MKLFLISNKILAAVIFLSFGITLVIAGEPTTNSIPSDLFLTDNGSLFWYRKGGIKVVNLREISKAQNSTESRPARQDLEGHWGQPTNGFQASLRFDKMIYTNGEPIIAITLIRNITSQSQTYFRAPQVLAMRNGKPLSKKNKEMIDVQIYYFPQVTLFPQTQRRYQAKLDEIYDLSEGGQYVFEAECKSPEVASQPVSIFITNTLSIK